MKGYDIKFLDELKSKNDIVDTIGRYVRLEQRGGNFWGKCPFHHEKTASFSVNASGQFYYCFGCHKSGDVINFIMEIEALDFTDAIRFLAEKAKMPLPEVKYDDEKIKEQKRRRQRAYDVLRETAHFYLQNLRGEKGEEHLDYAYKRKLSNETLVKFGMGASLDFYSLPNYLRGKGYTNEEMVFAGVCGEKDGRCFDWLGKRLCIPIIDQFNNVVGFSGRRIDGAKEQKYINTKETEVFMKGKTFFNINNLKKVKNEKGLDSVIIVEGHLDVISLYQAGVHNVVASMGTALTKDQARMLKRYSEKIYICYDGDFAGQKAAIRGLEILSEEGLEVKVVSLPDGMDPDDVIKGYGLEGYRKLLASAMPLIDFKLDILRRTYDISTVDGKRKYTSNAIRVIRESSSPAEQEDLLKTVRDLTGTTFEALKRELYAEKPLKEEVKEAVRFNDNLGDKLAIASRYILASYLFNKPFASEYDITQIDFETPVYEQIKEYIKECEREGRKAKFSDLYEVLGDEENQELSRLAGLETDEKKTFDQATYFFDCIKALKSSKISRDIENLTVMFAKETDSEKRKIYASEMKKLLDEKSRMK